MISLSQPPRTGDALRTFRATIRTFIQTEFVPHQDRWREQRFPDADAWTKAGAVGMLLSDVPMEYGGGGGTFAHEAVIVEGPPPPRAPFPPFPPRHCSAPLPASRP